MLRDLCTCHLCLDPSTKQKLFSIVDIPARIEPESLTIQKDQVQATWKHDVPGYPGDHVTTIPLDKLRSLQQHGTIRPPISKPARVLWSAQTFDRETKDINYENFMTDDRVLFSALRQLHTHGLAFLSSVPEKKDSAALISERIGPLKNTFYGPTWDVRSVPEAVNVAYTSQDLDFHMDLMYMKQPPHLQVLHCLRSSSSGGKSRFIDSFKAAVELFEKNPDDFRVLSKSKIFFHYDHPGSQYYWQSRNVIETKPMRVGPLRPFSIDRTEKIKQEQPELELLRNLNPVDFIEAVAWSPPFQAPFTLDVPLEGIQGSVKPGALKRLGNKVEKWQRAAKNFKQLIERPEMIHERLMTSGSCVIFDNRRILHARTAFQVDDAGKERWLIGCYIDKDPYLSKLKVLTDRYEGMKHEKSPT